MTFQYLLLFSFLQCLYGSVLALVDADPSLVTIPDGTLQGVVLDKSRYFKGVPYAAPPLNDLRWRPPQPVKTWSGVWDATDFRWGCLQSTNFDPPMTNLSENCLYLNIYAPLPPTNTSQLFPVLFWIHGGGYTNGGGNESRANGTWEVELRQDIIIVTFDYRLNIFGFLGSDELRSRSPDGSTGNYGLQDQIYALEWVKANIKYFYGDVNNIMIYGESAGAGSVSNLLVMPRAWGLYHKAIMESGSFSYFATKSWDATQSVYQNVLTQSNCPNVDCLLKLTGDQLVALYQQIPAPCMDQGAWTPAIDGVDIFDYPWNLVLNGYYAKVPVIAGSQKDEQLTPLPYNATQTDFDNFIANTYGKDLVASIDALYPASNYPPTATASSYWWASVQVNADFTFAAPARRTVRWFSQWGSWLYIFTYPKSWGGSTDLYAYHSEELPFVFLCENLLNGTDEIELSTNMAWFWTNFGADYDPNSGGSGGAPLFNWPRYRNDTDMNIVFDIDLSTQTALRKSTLDFWDTQFQRFSTCRKSAN